MATDTLTVREHMTLDLVSRHYKYPAVRETHARHELGYSETRLWQVVNDLLTRPAALRAQPMLVRRLIRQRDTRRAHRTA